MDKSKENALEQQKHASHPASAPADGALHSTEPIYTTNPGARDEPIARNDTSFLLNSKNEPDDLQGLRKRISEVSLRDTQVGLCLNELLLYVAKLSGYDFEKEDEHLAKEKMKQEEKMQDTLKEEELEHRANQLAPALEDEQVRKRAEEKAAEKTHGRHGHHDQAKGDR
ncbi:MAG: hypothetical protein ABI324_06320 [Ktedonobacteraceae bacterium]